MEEMMEAASSFFDAFMNEDGATRDIMEGIADGKMVSEEENATLLNPVTMEEVKQAVFGLDEDSAAGPDGFANDFYQIMWPTIQHHIHLAINNFFTCGKFVKSINRTNVMLIPKFRGATRIEDFRPIALYNSLYKIISKVMVNHMQNILNRITCLNQGAFLKGRIIHDQVALANDLVDFLHKRKSEAIMLKMDLSKAMLRLGFHPTWVTRIMTCVSTVTFSILLNGEEGRFFESRKGLRQGDPLSPYLFIIVMELFGRGLQNRLNRGIIKLPKMPHSLPNIKSLLFADD
ncbi:Transposon TX1 uncharacterized protein, partial [Nymphaea thermarum]